MLEAGTQIWEAGGIKERGGTFSPQPQYMQFAISPKSQ